MRRFVMLGLALALFPKGPARAQEALPESFAGWRAQGTAQPVHGFLLEENNVLSQEEGLVSGEIRHYTRGREDLSIILDRMKDPTGAYSAYSFMRTAGMQPSHVSEHSSISASSAVILAGNFVLVVSGMNVRSHEVDLKKLVEKVAAFSDRSPYPSLWQDMPQAGLLHASDRYILGPEGLKQVLPLADGDWLGFSVGAEAEAARYQADGRQMTLLIADFPTPQLAARQLKQIESTLNVNAANPQSNPPPIFAKRSMTLLVLVAGAPGKAAADHLLDQVQANTLLTWDDPTFSAKQPNAAAVIIGMISGTGIICMIALAGGLVFGGVRLFVKHVLPGKIFDRKRQIEVLQLGISNRSIDMQDFYS